MVKSSSNDIFRPVGLLRFAATGFKRNAALVLRKAHRMDLSIIVLMKRQEEMGLWNLNTKYAQVRMLYGCA